MMRRLSLIIAIIALTTVVMPVAAQQPPEDTSSSSSSSDAAQPTAAEAPPQPIPIAEIARAVERDTRRLRNLSTRIASAADVESEFEKLPAVAAAIEQLASAFNESELDRRSLRHLEQLRQQWRRHDPLLEDWQQQLESRLTKLEEINAELGTLREKWKATAKAAEAGGVAEELTAQIPTVQAAIEATTSEAEGRAAHLLARQLRVAELRSLISNAVEEIDDARIAARYRIFGSDSRPLWSVLAEKPPASLVSQVSESWGEDRRQLAEFLDTYGARVPFHLLFLAALVGGMLALRRRSRSWVVEEGDEQLAVVVRILGRPIAAAFFLAMFFTRWFYPRAPLTVYELNALLGLIPVLRLLPPLVYPRLRPAVYGLGALFALEQFHGLLNEQSALQRLMHFGVTLAALGMGLWLLRQGRRTSSGNGNRWWRVTLAGIRFAVVLFGVSALANLFGAMTLAELLTTATLKSTYAALAVFAAVLILGGLIAIGLRSPVAQNSRMVRDHRELLTGRAIALLHVAAVVLWGGMTLTFFLVFDLVWSWLAAVFGRTLTVGNLSISLGGIVTFGLMIWISTLISRFLRFVLDEDVFPRLPLARGVPQTLSMLINYTILSLGFLAAMAAAGIELSQFTIVLGALGVGIGFGLQNVVNNFISGLILIFERPIKVGDTVEVGPLLGQVRRIGIRASTIRTYDGAEVIVPNGDLISKEVVNWTLSDQLRRIEVLVGVAYGTDPERVLGLLVETARAHAKALKYPAPAALFDGFGDSSLNFRLRFWTADFDNWVNIRSEVTVAVNNAIVAAGIEIPFPQRDLHLRSVDGPAADAFAPRKAEAGPKSEPGTAAGPDPSTS